MLTTTDAALEATRRRSQFFASRFMKNTHPIELAIVLVIGLCESAWWLFRTVVVPAVVIVAVLVGYSPTRGVAPTSANHTEPTIQAAQTPSQAALAAPIIHPLTSVGDSLRQLTNRQLMALVGTKKKMTKDQLVGALIAS